MNDRFNWPLTPATFKALMSQVCPIQLYLYANPKPQFSASRSRIVQKTHCAPQFIPARFAGMSGRARNRTWERPSQEQMAGKQRVGLAGNINPPTEGAGAFKPMKKEAAKMMALAMGFSPTCQLATSAQADANPPNAGTTPIEGCSSERPLSEDPRAPNSILSE